MDRTVTSIDVFFCAASYQSAEQAHAAHRALVELTWEIDCGIIHSLYGSTRVVSIVSLDQVSAAQQAAIETALVQHGGTPWSETTDYLLGVVRRHTDNLADFPAGAQRVDRRYDPPLIIDHTGRTVRTATEHDLDQQKRMAQEKPHD